MKAGEHHNTQLTDSLSFSVPSSLSFGVYYLPFTLDKEEGVEHGLMGLRTIALE